MAQNSQQRANSIINNSTSKQQFAFSKAARFPSPKQPTNAFGYEVKSNFMSERKNPNAAFGVREERWGYEEKKKHQRGLGGLDSPDTVNPLSTKLKTFSYSFGVSRSAMKKIHVDEILKKKEDNLPGPDRYGKKDTFGPQANATAYSMRQRLGHFERKLEKETKLPGPGFYNQGDLVGKGIGASTMRSATQSSFPKSTDRFRPPKQQSPPVTTYSVKDGLNQNFSSVRNFAGSTKFGTNTKNFIDNNWHLDRAKNQPGPDAYTKFSDFAGAQ